MAHGRLGLLLGVIGARQYSILLARLEIDNALIHAAMPQLHVYL